MNEGKYELYINKENCEIKLKNVTKKPHLITTDYPEEVKMWNSNYYMCSDRKKLKQFALELKELWIKDKEEKIKEEEEKLAKLKNLKI